MVTGRASLLGLGFWSEINSSILSSVTFYPDRIPKRTGSKREAETEEKPLRLSS
jgi:hypothetical protein